MGAPLTTWTGGAPKGDVDAVLVEGNARGNLREPYDHAAAGSQGRALLLRALSTVRIWSVAYSTALWWSGDQIESRDPIRNAIISSRLEIIVRTHARTPGVGPNIQRLPD